ncbi:MAG TPA: E3 binding domain-containing protein, partial [Pseudomonadales bacterium]|nr:E3 binding domain-containing protein [Pseudomonadales bacterium]
MPKEIYLVKVGMTMTEGMVSEWYIADGQQVVKGEMLYALETEKINMDVDAETNGTVKHLIQVGEMMEPGDVVGFIFEQDEEVPEDLSTLPVNRNTAINVVDASMEPSPEASSPIVKDQPVVKDGNLRIKSSPATRRLARELGVDLSTVTGSGPGGRIVEADVRPARREAPKASPLAKRLAAEKGVDISLIEGSGPGGRIVREDIEAALDKESEGPGQQAETGKTIPISGMRKTIARRMFASLQNSAQLTMNMEVLMDDAVRLRDSLIEQW